MTSTLVQTFADLSAWRGRLVDAIERYKAWLDSNGIADINQSLRIYDLIESLRNDRITLAFIAEYSRGKTELINALLFSDFKRRMLPSDVGRTTMCPTEILWDPTDDPYIRLLPIETRKRDESIASLRLKPVEWVKVRLDLSSPDAMAASLATIIDRKTVTQEEAQALGLMDRQDPETSTAVLQDGRVEISCWRHAVVSYPHPLLKSGLTVLDTPGLNAIGTEPELTMSMIPSAHAVLFLLALDTGVTRSDLETWQRFVSKRVARAIAVLNKIDLAWDELKTQAEIDASIEKQLAATAATLDLPRSQVLALSAQKALVARVRGDTALLRRSGIEQLEAMLANEMVPAKQEILRVSVLREIGTMLNQSLQTIVLQFRAARDEHKTLVELSGRNRGMAKAMLMRLEQERSSYTSSVETVSRTAARLMEQGTALLGNLGAEAIDRLVDRDRKYIDGAWTTAGLMNSMEALFDHFAAQANRILTLVGEIRSMLDTTYGEIRVRYGLETLDAPVLSLEPYVLAMHNLRDTTREFVHNPVSVMTEKHFLVKKFHTGLVSEARRIFDETRSETETWLKGALNPLRNQLGTHQRLLGTRAENLRKIRDNVTSVTDRVKQLEAQQLALKQQAETLSAIKTDLATPGPATSDKLSPARAA